MYIMEEKANIEKIAKKYSLKLLLLFGSQANGKNRADSDFDIAYIAKKELSMDEKISLNNEFISLFNCDKIDLTDLKEANALLIYEISQNCKMLFGDDEDLANFKIFAFKNYIDHIPLFELEEVLVKKRQTLLKDAIYN